MISKADYVKKLQAQLDEWNSEIKILRTDSQKAKANVKREYEKRIEQLYQNCEAAKKKRHSIQESNNVGWEELKEGTEEMWSGIKQLFRDTKTGFCKGLKEGKK